MSGRNRRRSPATADELRKVAGDIRRLLQLVEPDYLALLGSGYAKPHRKAGEQLGDPADLVEGTVGRIRHLMTRAAEGMDDAYDGAAQARYWLLQVALLIDEDATPGGIDEDLPTASTGEVRRAEQAQRRRTERVADSGLPWAGEEITG